MLHILSVVIHWLINSLWTQVTSDSVFYCAVLTQGFEHGVSANGFSVNGFRALEFRIPDASGTMGEPLDYCIWGIVLESPFPQLSLLLTQQACEMAKMDKLCTYEVSAAFVGGW